jgi:hypothetical protein
MVVLVGAIAAAYRALRFARWEASWVFGAFVAHVVAAVAQVLITESLYGGGDIFGYARVGRALGTAMSLDFQGMAPEVLRLLFQQDAVLPVVIQHPDSPTGSMYAVSGILAFITSGDVYTLCIAVAVLAYLGKVAMLEAFFASVPREQRPVAIAAVLWMPSVVFWSSGLVKEGVAMAGFGVLFRGVQWLLARRWTGGALSVMVGGGLVALVKPYILFAFAPAAVAWVLWDWSLRSGRGGPRPVVIGGTMLLGFLAIVGLGYVFPQFSLDHVAEEAAYLQEAGQVARGASTYAIGSGDARTLGAQLGFAPLALVSSLFRPFLFEAGSLQILVNALETTFLLALAIGAFTRRGALGVVKFTLRSPLLVACVVFTLLFGVAVGLGTTNLGALSRYRMPLVPSFAFLLMVLALPRSATVDAAPALRGAVPR